MYETGGQSALHNLYDVNQKSTKNGVRAVMTEVEGWTRKVARQVNSDYNMFAEPKCSANRGTLSTFVVQLPPFLPPITTSLSANPRGAVCQG